MCVLASAMDDSGVLIKYNCACVDVNKLSDLTTCTVQIQSL